MCRILYELGRRRGAEQCSAPYSGVMWPQYVRVVHSVGVGFQYGAWKDLPSHVWWVWEGVRDRWEVDVGCFSGEYGLEEYCRYCKVSCGYRRTQTTQDYEPQYNFHPKSQQLTQYDTPTKRNPPNKVSHALLRLSPTPEKVADLNESTSLQNSRSLSLLLRSHR